MGTGQVDTRYRLAWVLLGQVDINFIVEAVANSEIGMGSISTGVNQLAMSD